MAHFGRISPSPSATGAVDGGSSLPTVITPQPIPTPSIHLISALNRASQSVKHHSSSSSSSSTTTTATSSLSMIESLRDARDAIESFLSSIDTDEPMLDEREGVEKGDGDEMVNRDDVDEVGGIRECFIEGSKRRRKRSTPASWSEGRVAEDHDDEVLRIGALIGRRRDAIELVFQFHG